jgi:hypothetical protein
MCSISSELLSDEAYVKNKRRKVNISNIIRAMLFLYMYNMIFF